MFRISNGKSGDGSRYLYGPEIVAVCMEGTGICASISQPINSTTGMDLRKLADEADAIWAEYEQHRQNANRATAQQVDQ